MPRDKLIRSSVLVSALVMLSLLGPVLFWVASIGGPEAVHARYGLLAPLVTLPAHLMVNVIAIGEFIPWSIANGVAYGFALGALLSWAAWMGAAVVQYVLARRLGQNQDVERQLAALPRWVQRFPVSHPVFLIAGRWVPMGGPFTNVAAGAFGVPAGRMLWCAGVGYSVEAMLNAALGAGLLRLF